jgi:uncharacterized membrane protein
LSYLSLLPKSKIPQLLLACFIITYTVYFSWYTINRHHTLNSYAADLSLIDQPMWNTVRGPGGFMELTWGDHQQPRLAEHFEPILIPLALLFFLWDDVRILLITQSLALALGALPVFWITRSHVSRITHHVSRITSHTSNNSQTANWVALSFAVVYLLSPHLQAANVADLHADPFVVPPLLFAFWYATQKRWGWMWFWAIVVMLTKETLPTLTAMLGAFLIFDAYRPGYTKEQTEIQNRKSKILNGLLLVLVSAAWFLAATFLIVAPLARQYFGAAGPIYFANRYAGGLTGLSQLLQDPGRWQYLLGLLAAVGFLPLLAPELLILGLPVLAANLLSNFPGQYSGEQHYSAPLVVAFVVAAIYGTRRLIDNTPPREKNRQSLKITTLIGVVLWLLTWALSYHALHGWTPLSIRTEIYRMSPAASRLPDFTSQIPPDAILSASAAVHPHLAHRRVIYIFPTVQEADYLLVDVADIPGIHPNDAHTQLIDMLNTDWQLLKADHGLLLAQRSSSLNTSTPQLPSPFFDFVRPATPPAYPTSLTFGDGRLRLSGYDVHDDPDDGVTFRFYWQTSDKLPQDLRLWPLVYDDTGQLLNNPAQVPMIATVWYPPAVWQPNEIFVTKTLPQLLPDIFHLGLAAGPANSFSDPSQFLPVANTSDKKTHGHLNHWAQLATFKRQGPFLTHLPPTPTLQPLANVEAQFGPSIQLTGFWLDATNLRPGSDFSILLQWIADQPPQADYTVFIHLLAPDGNLVAQSDAFPTWLTPQPTSRWPRHQPILDHHTLVLPNDLPLGIYTLEIGLYNAQTLERLPRPDGTDTFQLTKIEIK